MEDKNSKSSPDLWQVILEYLRDVVYLLAAVILVFSFVARFIVVSGNSMYATLVDGDYLILLNNHFCGEYEQGDIVVAGMNRFRNGEAIVKRVIATEGQTVDIDFNEGIVYVDGIALDEPYTFTPTSHSEGTEFPLTVNDGCYFLMGDNRNGSMDSRNPLIGQVDGREILGKAVFLLFPGTNGGALPLDLSRIGGLS